VNYSVRVLSVGESKIRGPEVFWMSHWDEILPLAFNVTLIQGEGTTIPTRLRVSSTMGIIMWPSISSICGADTGSPSPSHEAGS